MSKIGKFCANVCRAAETTLVPFRTISVRRGRYACLSGKSDGLIVSLTSFPPRMKTLPLVLDSLMRQSLKPDKIILALAKDDFPGGLDDVPASVKTFAAYGVEIAFVEDNLYCHLKYHYVMRRYPEATIVTVDDDSIYCSNMLQGLVALGARFPGAVCCNIAACIDRDHFYEYGFWHKTSEEHSPSGELVALGFAGVLYPPHALPETAFDIDLIRELSPKADDLWLKAVETVACVKVASTKRFKKPVTVPGSQIVSLRSTNKGMENRNDIQWRRLDDHFHLKDKIWMQS